MAKRGHATIRKGAPTPLAARRLVVRAVRNGRRQVHAVKASANRVGFPYRAPTIPKGYDVPAEPSKLGANFETDWARGPLVNGIRAALTEGPVRLGVKLLADPTVIGADRLHDYKSRGDEDAQPLIFAPNHHSHIDTPISITSIPRPWRHKLIVAAAADYFFTSRLKGSAAAIVLNALPIDREAVGRKSSDEIKALVDDGWSLIIYPEGGRSPDGWGQEFKGGAAYLSIRTGAPVVPIFIDGSGSIYGKGMKRPKAGSTKVVIGTPLRPEPGETTRRFNARIEQANAQLGDEALTDFWTARQRAAKGRTTDPKGPEFGGWRRQWALGDARNKGAQAGRTRQKRRWPKLAE